MDDNNNFGLRAKVDKIFEDYTLDIERFQHVCQCGKHLYLSLKIPLDLLQNNELIVELKPLE